MHKTLIAISIAVLGILGCGGTNGPNINLNGRTACDQYRECLCDPERLAPGQTADQCNATVDALESQANGIQQCAARVAQVNGPCAGGRQLGFDESRVGF